MTTYTLSVQIDDAVLRLGAKDSLCIAKKVNDGYNVIFQGAAPVPVGDQKLLVANNVFSWVDKYQVYLTSSYGNGVLIQQSSKTVDIHFGQESIWQNGSLSQAKGADTSAWDTSDGSGPNSTFAVEGFPISLHAAVRQSTGGGAWSTIYVDPDVHMSTTRVELTPKNEYLVFWKKITTTEAMLAIATTQGYVWSFPEGETNMTLRFGYAKAEHPMSALEAPNWYEA